MAGRKQRIGAIAAVAALRAALGAALVVPLVAGSAPAGAVELTGETITGLAQVVAGDTLLMSGRALRLIGVAVPGASKPGAAAARMGLYKLVDSRIVICHLSNERLGPAVLAGCEAGGNDISALMIDHGYALDCPAMSKGRYRAQEARARAAGTTPKPFAMPPECGIVKAAGR